MVHIKKEKGNIATAKVIADLTEKGYTTFTPTISEHLPFDVLAYKDGQFYRIQAKYSSNGGIHNKTNWNDRNGTHTKKYSDTDFDYYGIYLPDIKLVVYPSIKFGGKSIRTDIPNSATPFYWWEDFLFFTDEAGKRTYKEFGVEIAHAATNKMIEAKNKMRKVERPSKEELGRLLWEKPTIQLAKQFGVSDKAIEKWAKSYGLKKPPRGYWAKLKSNQ